MKSTIPIDETWTVTSFRNTENHADEILSKNGLPYSSVHDNNNVYDNLYLQQEAKIQDTVDSILQGASPTVTEDDQVQSIRQNLNDYDKAYAIAMLDSTEFLSYQLTQMLPGFLQTPETLVDEKTSVDEATRREIMRSGIQLSEVRALLAPHRELDIVPPSAAKNVPEEDWFWKPTGDVMFAVEGQDPIEIPCWPESIRDSTSATWSQEMTTYQHYEPKNTYKGSGPRVVSCTFKIHRAMWTGNQDSGDSEKLVAYLQSACYPDYDTQAAEPPRSLLTVGTSVRIKGILTSMETTYQGPIGPDNRYDEVIISISITEESDNVLSTAAVRGGLAGWR